MLHYYLPIKAVHVAAILASGSLFALRGGAALAGWRWATASPLRYLSFAIDTVLLTAALMLLTALKLNPVTTPWLAVKLALLVAYILLGSMALRYASGPRQRLAWWLAALACYGAIYLVARSHHPFGPLAGLLS